MRKEYMEPEIALMNVQTLEEIMTNPSWYAGEAEIPWASLSLN